MNVQPTGGCQTCHTAAHWGEANLGDARKFRNFITPCSGGIDHFARGELTLVGINLPANGNLGDGLHRLIGFNLPAIGAQQADKTLQHHIGVDILGGCAQRGPHHVICI